MAKRSNKYLGGHHEWPLWFKGFLVFGVVVDSMLRDAQHPLRPSMKAFTQSLGAALEQAGAAVVERDFVEMHAVLATCVLPTLERYAEFGPRLTSALQPRLAG